MLANLKPLPAPPVIAPPKNGQTSRIHRPRKLPSIPTSPNQHSIEELLPPSYEESCRSADASTVYLQVLEETQTTSPIHYACQPKLTLRPPSKKQSSSSSCTRPLSIPISPESSPSAGSSCLSCTQFPTCIRGKSKKNRSPDGLRPPLENCHKAPAKFKCKSHSSYPIHNYSSLCLHDELKDSLTTVAIGIMTAIIPFPVERVLSRLGKTKRCTWCGKFQAVSH